MASIGPLALGAKGCVERLHPTGETTHYILCVAPLLQNVFAVHRFAQGAADWRSGSRWKIISALCPVHPFPLRGNSPQGETRDMKRKNRGVICFMYYSSISPFGGWRHHLSAPLGSVSLDSQSPTAPCESCDTLSRGEVRRSRIGGGERSEPISRMLFMPYDIESQSRNADFMFIARKGDTTTFGAEGSVKLKNPPAHRAGPS